MIAPPHVATVSTLTSCGKALRAETTDRHDRRQPHHLRSVVSLCEFTTWSRSYGFTPLPRQVRASLSPSSLSVCILRRYQASGNYVPCSAWEHLERLLPLVFSTEGEAMNDMDSLDWSRKYEVLTISRLMLRSLGFSTEHISSL